jgi:hypothetical protein
MRILGVARSTVLNHRNMAMRVLGTGKCAILTRLAIKHGISSMKDKLNAAEKEKAGRMDDGWN